MEEKDILREELKKLQFPDMKVTKAALVYLRFIETNRAPTMYDLIKFAGKDPPEWYKDWGWWPFTWELLSNKYGAAAKHGKDGKVSHFTIYLPPPQPMARIIENPIYKLIQEREPNHEDSDEFRKES